MRCTNCNATIGDGASFCASCGHPVTMGGTQIPGPPAAPAPPAAAPTAPVSAGPPTPGAPPFPPPPGPQPWGGLERPSYAPTILITIFFGIFGLIPAVRHSRMARERGYSSSGYWWAFWVPAAVSITVSVVLVVTLALTAHQINDSLSAGSGTDPGSPTIPATTPATAPATTKPAPRGGSGNVAPGAITTSTNCPTDLTATLNKPSWASPPPLTIDPSNTYTAVVITDVGPFTIQLDPAAAPNTVNSFVFLAQQHFYDCIVFHRVIQSFVDQTGDPTGTGDGGPGYQFADELPPQATPQYPIGSVAMANSGPNTNGSQFFIVTGPEGEGLPPSYSLFGTVISGMDVVDKINADGSAASTSTGTPTTLHRMISVTVSES